MECGRNSCSVKRRMLPRARKIEICLQLQADLACPVSARKIIRLTRRANHRYKLAPSRPSEGRFAIVTNVVRDAVDATAPARKWQSQGGSSMEPVSNRPARGRTALMRTAKSCGSGTRCWCQVRGGFASPTGPSQNHQSADDGDKRNSSPGRARRKPLKPFAQGRPDCLR